MSSNMSDDDGSEDPQYMSMIDDGFGGGADVDPHVAGMAELLQMAEEAAAESPSPVRRRVAGADSEEHLREQVLKFSNELISLTARVSALSSEKLKMEFENRELRAKTIPGQIELQTVREENAFLKSQLAEFWTEIESVSREKNELFRNRCDVVRQLTDDVSSARSELDAGRVRLELAEAETERLRQQVAAQKHEMKAKEDAAAVELSATRERILKQEELVLTLERQAEVGVRVQESLSATERELATTSLALVDANAKLTAQAEEIAAMRAEKEKLLQQLVTNKENKKSIAAIDLMLGKGWSLSDLLDSVTSARAQIDEKRKEIDSLHSVIDEMKVKLPAVEANFLELQRCQLELEDVKKYNGEIKAAFEQREEAMDALRFEKMKIETDYQSLKIRCSEFGSHVSALVHENESLRHRIGIHSGPGRSVPSMTSPAVGGGRKSLVSALPALGNDMTSASGSGLVHYRTVQDLVEQNLELKETIDKLSNACETEAQVELVKLKSQYEKLEAAGRELVEKREGDKADYDRIISRLEAETKRSQIENEKLRKCLVGLDMDDINMDTDSGEAMSAMDAGVVRTQLKVSKEEFKKHLASVQQELVSARTVANRAAGELDKVREDLKREMDEKAYYVKGYERMKQDSLQLVDQHKSFATRANAAEVERDRLSVTVEELKSQNSLLDISKRELQQQLASAKQVVASTEQAFKDLVAEKESQSVVLVGYHTRLEQEMAMYRTNSEALKRLYTEESQKNKQTLDFYQSAYEEQVKRGNELSLQVSAISSDLAALRAEKAMVERDAEDLRLRLKLKDSSVVGSSVGGESTVSLNRDVVRLEESLKSMESDVAKWRDLARVNENLVDQLQQQMKVKEKEIVELSNAKQQQQAQVQQAGEGVGSQEESVHVEGQTAVVDVQKKLDESKSALVFAEKQLGDKCSELLLVEQRFREECIRHGEDVSKLDVALKRVTELQEQLHRERLLETAKESSLTEQAAQAKARAAQVEQEKTALEHRIAVLKTENEKYIRYFASDLGKDEKEATGRLVLEQLQSSMAVQSARENQLVSDLQRARSTVETLLHENRGMKAVAVERDSLQVQVAAAQERLRQIQNQLVELESVKTEREKLMVDVRVLKESLHVAELQRLEAVGAQDALRVTKSENEYLKSTVESLRQEADSFKQLHAGLVEKLSATAPAASTEELDRLRESEAKLQTDLAQVQQAKSLLTQTVSKLREEAVGTTERLHTDLKLVQSQLVAREKDVSRQDGLMKLKDKRIGELEAALAAAEPARPAESKSSQEVLQLMELVNEYHSVLAATSVGGDAASPQEMADEQTTEEGQGDAKRSRQSVYHDVNE